MPVYVVRHACAGDKASWPGPDADRPLDSVGRDQAEALADLLAPRSLRRLLSSPTRRCLDTLEPLAGRTGLPVEPADVLMLNASVGSAIDLLNDPGSEGAALCTHGEVMRELLAWAHRFGVAVSPASAHDEALLAKGTGWALEMSDGGPVRLEHLAPEPPVACTEHGQQS